MAFRLGCSSRLLGAVAAHTFIRSSTTNGIGNAANPSISYVAQRSLSDGKENVHRRGNRPLSPSELLRRDIRQATKELQNMRSKPRRNWLGYLCYVGSACNIATGIGLIESMASNPDALDPADIAIMAGMSMIF